MWSSARRLADETCVRAWSAGFAALHRLRPRSARPWIADSRRTVVVIAPHPDDEVIGCGGVILLHRQAGHDVSVVHVTDGRGSRAGGLDADSMARRRRGEAEACLAILGVGQWHWLGLPEWEWHDAEGAAALERVLGERRPSLIYAPSRVDFHPEHERVARVLGAVLGSVAGDATVRAYPIGVPLSRVLTNVVADVSAVWERVRQAVGAYRSQEGAVRFSLRSRRYSAAAHGLAHAAEEFWEMPARAYAALHARPPGAPGRFRGFRRLAWTDPLAYVAGRAARRALVPGAGDEAAR
jgi:LmbE family N-acetylglucosaminyl deacetylase